MNWRVFEVGFFLCFAGSRYWGNPDTYQTMADFVASGLTGGLLFDGLYGLFKFVLNRGPQ